MLGDGELFNHSDDANVEYRLVNVNERKVMRFFAKRLIMSTEQLFIDYSADVTVDLETYKNTKSLEG